MSKRLFVMGSVFLAILLVVGEAGAQVEGRLFGNVVDQSGSAVPGATVSLLLPGGDRAVLSVVSSAEGFFNFSNVRPELYDLTVEATGFRKQLVHGVKVDPARETTVSSIRLEVQGVSAKVAVIENVQAVSSFRIRRCGNQPKTLQFGHLRLLLCADSSYVQ